MNRQSGLVQNVMSRTRPTSTMLILAAALHMYAVWRDVSSRMTVADLLVAVPVIVVTGWMSQQRRIRQPLRWTSMSGVLLTMDVVCTLSGIVSSNTWMITCGLCFLLLAVLHASADHRSLRSLSILLLPVVPAISLSGMVDDWLKHNVSHVARTLISRVCHALRLPHYRDGDFFCLGDLRFSLLDMSDGLGSPIAWLALAFLVICVRRVSFIPASLFTLASMSVWGMLTLARGILGVSLLGAYEVEPIGETQRMIMDVCLQLLGLAVWVSAGHTVFWLTHPIPVSQFAESRSEEFNLLTFFWNRVMGPAPGRGRRLTRGSAGLSIHQLPTVVFVLCTAIPNLCSKLF